MKKHLILLAVLLQAASASLFAQSKPKAGDIISGIVSEDDGPMMMVNVTECDQDNRIIAHAITDKDGVFAFKLVNPNDRLKITYVGYETVDIPFDKIHFDIKMKEKMGKLIGTKKVYPRDRGMVEINTDYMAKLKQYAPEGFVCGYIMRNAWNKNLWGIFLVKEGPKYNLIYKEADKSETIDVDSDLAQNLEISVNKSITEIEYAVNNPVIVNVYEEELPVADILYDADYAFAVSLDKAAYYWTWTVNTEEVRDRKSVV